MCSTKTRVLLEVLVTVLVGFTPTIVTLYVLHFHSGSITPKGMISILVLDLVFACVALVLRGRRRRLNGLEEVQTVYQDVESRDDPPEYDEVIAKAPPYKWVIQQDMARHSEVITMPVPISEGIPSVHHQSLEEWDGNGVPVTDPDLPTYLETITPSSETKT